LFSDVRRTQTEPLLRAQVFIYYGLTNYFSNYRRYVKSVDYSQLSGGTQLPTAPCSPLAVDSASGLPIDPCGFIANSFFNGMWRARKGWNGSQFSKRGQVRLILRLAFTNSIASRRHTQLDCGSNGPERAFKRGGHFVAIGHRQEVQESPGMGGDRATALLDNRHCQPVNASRICMYNIRINNTYGVMYRNARFWRFKLHEACVILRAFCCSAVYHALLLYSKMMDVRTYSLIPLSF
jgi:hypothetical protein